MDSNEFKSLFDEIAILNRFEKLYGGWFRESQECILALDLQKSKYGNYFELNIKIFVQGLFKNYVKNKDLVKKETGDVFLRAPNEYRDIFDLTHLISPMERQEKLKTLFDDFIVPFTDEALSKSGIKNLADKGKVFLLPAVKERLS